ncbi:MAG: Trm112 family protein [Proteobacteria bacterium]|jgi:uncharacterized protein YbaR (Trm112 family)|nr:Trm112 family protein [Pseudomonadota bacterium]MDA1135106.1 Trm112 family protein [Pseudomonadota bacterium]|tara:strand:+ start:194 stop:400 length:207 start_codon:yes stop_codon:yes gene_type:complete
MSSSTETIFLDKVLLGFLVCPITKSKLLYNIKSNELISEKAGLAFPIINGVPILIIEEARSIKSDNTK